MTPYLRLPNHTFVAEFHVATGDGDTIVFMKLGYMKNLDLSESEMASDEASCNVKVNVYKYETV